MSDIQDFDVVVVGGGPGGYVAALRAAQLELRTALVERDSLGGVCLNWGCIPTKALLHAADVLRSIRSAAELGIVVDPPRVEFSKVIARSRAVAGQLSRGVSHLLRKAGVVTFNGNATLTAQGEIEVRAEAGKASLLRAGNIVLATGARPRAFPGLPFGGRVWSYREALSATEIPESMAIIGAGAIGLEFASFYAAMGSQVTVIEAQRSVLPLADRAVGAFLQKSLVEQGIDILTGARIGSVSLAGDEAVIQMETDSGAMTVNTSVVLVAIGLAGNVESLGLEGAGVEMRDGRVLVDGWGETSRKGAYAIGDLVGAPMLAHRASHQGVVCAERIAGTRRGSHAREQPIASCTYCHPQTASIGLTEEQARSSQIELRIGQFPLVGNGKAVTAGSTAGFVKTIFNGLTGELIGAHIVGPEAPELIHGFALGMSLETTETELMDLVFPHPTVSEAMHESVLAAYGRPLHI